MSPVRPYVGPIIVVITAALTAACPGDDAGVVGTEPRVVLRVMETNPAALKIPIEVEVYGCDQVLSLEIYDRDTFIKKISYTGNPSKGELLPNEVPYRGKMAADLSLRALA